MSKPPYLVLPSGARAHRLATRRGEFAVHDTGTAPSAGGGTVLLVPGFTGSKEDFIALLRPLSEAGLRAVAVDGRGQYETGGPAREAAYAQDELVRDVLAQAEALGGDRIHLVGHSLGGQIARAALLRDASPFGSLTLVSSGPAAVTSPQQSRLKLLLGALGVLDMESIWQAMQELDPPEAPEDDTSPDVRSFLHRRWLATLPQQLTATAGQLLTEPDRVAELAEVPLPMHVLSGERDYAWSVPLFDDMARRLGARRTVIAGAEHSPNVDAPVETARALIESLPA